jgi:hypothetical protein
MTGFICGTVAGSISINGRLQQNGKQHGSDAYNKAA